MKNLFTKKQAQEDKDYRYGLTWISMEMAEELGLADVHAMKVAFPKEFIHMVVELKSRGKILKVNDF